MNKSKPEIREINHSLGYTVCDGNKPLYIEVNKNLRKYPKLRKDIIKHEMLHWNNTSGLWGDFKIDFLDLFNIRKQADIFGFQLNHPKAFFSASPFLIENKKIIPNYFMCTFYGIFLLAIGGISLI